MFKKAFFIILALLMSAQITQGQTKLSKGDQTNLTKFIAGNITWTLFHELGHGLVSLYDIPILAKEEDAVDNFATISLLLQETEQADRFLEETAYGWFLMAEHGAVKGIELNFSDDHSLDEQRAFQTICFMYGADPKKFERFVELMGLPEERIENCERDFSAAMLSWDKVLKPQLLKNNEVNNQLLIQYQKAKKGQEKYKNIVQKSKLFEIIKADIEQKYKLPVDVMIEAMSCGEPNAFWDPNTNKVTLCYELVAEFEKLFLFDLTQAAKQ